jgi:predicted nucleotidyltransferase component of viral defense system
MDFTFDEELVFPINHESVLVQYSDCSSVSKSLDVYSLEEILTEKLCALIGRT